MRRMDGTPYSREHCLSRALELEWSAQNAPSPTGAAQAWDEARHWRSLALVAPPATADPKGE